MNNNIAIRSPSICFPAIMAKLLAIAGADIGADDMYCVPFKCGMVAFVYPKSVAVGPENKMIDH